MEDGTSDLNLSSVNYREIFDGINDGIFLLCPDTGRTLEINLPCCRMFGYDRDELLGKRNIGLLSSGTPPYTEEAVFQRIPLVMSGQPQVLDWQCRAKDGRLFWAEMSVRHLDLGGVPTVVAVMRETTESKELINRFRQLSESISEVFWLNDAEMSQMLYISPAYEAIWGRSCDDLYRDSSLWLEAIHDEDRARVASAVEIRRNSEYHEEYRIVRPDGSVRWVEDNGFPVEDAFGRVVRFAGVARDITERKRIEQLKDEFVSTVSHELRTPLTSIAGALGLMAGGAVGALPDKAVRLIEIANNNCERLVRLISDILDIEKIESGQMQFHMKPVEMDSLVRRTIEENVAYAEKYGVRLDYEPFEGASIVWGDPDRLIQALTNILSNAVKFSPRDRHVTVSTSSGPSSYLISVRDRGPGIPEEFQSRLFDRFAQFDHSDARQYGGTGLGLAISRDIVVCHSGDLSFESAADWGTVFHIDLPLHRSNDAPATEHSGTTKNSTNPAQDLGISRKPSA